MKKFIISFFAFITLLLLKPIPAYSYNSISGGTLSFKHYFVMDVNARVPKVTFRGEIVPAEGEGNIEPGPLPSYIDGVSYSCKSTTYDSVQPGDDVTLDSGKKYAKGTFTIDLTGAQFDKPGVFRYEVTVCKEGCSDGITECQKLYLDVYITEDASGNLAASAQFLHLPGSTEKVTSITHNYYSHDVRVKNQVTGNQGDCNKDFLYTFRVYGENPDKEYTVILKDSTKINIKSGQETTALLKHGEEFCLCGLSEHEKFIITESNYISDGYKTSYVLDSNPSKMEYSTKIVQIGDADRLVVYTNEKNKDEPVTGIFIDNTIYILMLGFFVSLGFLILLGRRKSLKNKI